MIVGKCTPSGQRLGIEVQVYPPDKRCRDNDNILKGILDSLVSCGLMIDDEQIDDIRVIRCDKVQGGKINVRLFELVQQQGTHILTYRALYAKIEAIALKFDIKHKQECLYRYLWNLSKTSKSDLDRFFERHVKLHGQDATEKLKQDARQYYKNNKMA